MATKTIQACDLCDKAIKSGMMGSVLERPLVSGRKIDICPMCVWVLRQAIAWGLFDENRGILFGVQE